MPRTVVVAYAALLVIVSGAVILVARRSESLAVSHRGEDYQEECQSEGCNTEEVRELHESYREECIEERCDKEEVIELGGSPSGAIAMFDDFQRRGWTVQERDRLNLFCTAVGSETQCALVVMLCKDIWICGDGTHTSSWYACGSCIGFGSSTPSSSGSGAPR